MISSRGVLAAVSGVALVVAASLAVTHLPSATAANPVSVEAETMSVSPSFAASSVRDGSASGGVALTLRSPATASKAIALPAKASLVVRARSQRTCGSAPTMDVTVDGKSISTTKVTATAWTDYTTPISIAAGSHSIGIVYASKGWNFFCIRTLSIDTVTVVDAGATTTSTTPTTTTTTTTPTTTTPTSTTTTPTTTTPSTTTTSPPTPTSPTSVPAARLFNGDYSTGDFSQWGDVQNKYYNGRAANYQPAYPATIVTDPQKGYTARYEVRSGDAPFGTGERSEVLTTASASGGTEGQIRWYRFSTKFDTTFPMNHADLGWGLTNQWHATPDSVGSPPFGMYVDQRNGYWSLTIQKQSRPGTYEKVFSIWDTPLDRGNWHDITMQVKFSTSDSSGWIRLWQNGVQQRFVDGSDTYRVRTLIPGTTSVYYKEGYYRQPMAPTGIVYHTGFRAATEEGGLN